MTTSSAYLCLSLAYLSWGLGAVHGSFQMCLSIKENQAQAWAGSGSCCLLLMSTDHVVCSMQMMTVFMQISPLVLIMHSRLANKVAFVWLPCEAVQGWRHKRYLLDLEDKAAQ